MRAGRVKSARFDIKDSSRKNRKSNYMDITGNSGYARFHSKQSCHCVVTFYRFLQYRVRGLRLAIIHILKLLPGGMVHFGMKCSSFCGMNKGTSGRSACASVGYLGHPSVRAANLMLERTLSPGLFYARPSGFP